jgi:hypothetical protein
LLALLLGRLLLDLGLLFGLLGLITLLAALALLFAFTLSLVLLAGALLLLALFLQKSLLLFVLFFLLAFGLFMLGLLALLFLSLLTLLLLTFEAFLLLALFLPLDALELSFLFSLVDAALLLADDAFELPLEVAQPQLVGVLYLLLFLFLGLFDLLLGYSRVGSLGGLHRRD